MYYFKKLLVLMLTVAFVNFGCGMRGSNPPLPTTQDPSCPVTASDTDGDCIPNDYEVPGCENDIDCDDNGFHDNEDPPREPPELCETSPDTYECLNTWGDIKKYLSLHWGGLALIAAAGVGAWFGGRALIRSWKYQDRTFELQEPEYSSASYLLFAGNKMEINVVATYSKEKDGETSYVPITTNIKANRVNDPLVWLRAGTNDQACEDNDVCWTKPGLPMEYFYEVKEKEALNDRFDHISVHGDYGDDDDNDFISPNWLGLSTYSSAPNLSDLCVKKNGAEAKLLKMRSIVFNENQEAINVISCFDLGDSAEGIDTADNYIKGKKWLRKNCQSAPFLTGFCLGGDWDTDLP